MDNGYRAEEDLGQKEDPNRKEAKKTIHPLLNSITLTQEHFNKFVFYCKEWIEILGLTDWSVNYIFCSVDDLDKLEGNMASVFMNRSGMKATVYLNNTWELVFPDDFELRKCAFHEMAEILIEPLGMLTRIRFGVHEEDIDYEIHRIIRRLENVCMAHIRSAENNNDQTQLWPKETINLAMSGIL